MSPRKACPVCGLGGCTRHRRKATRRAYSDTAAYRAMRQAVLEAYGDACAFCLLPIPLVGASKADELVLAHVIAEADGGPFELDNLRPAHRSCNASAGRDPIIAP